jgi:hypothetical protein
MKISEFIYDIREILGAIDSDSDISDLWILYKINQYRAVHIVQEYALTDEIDPSWLQRIHKFKWIKCNASDDPQIIYSSITLGKTIIPRTIKLPYDIGTYRISGSGSIQQFEPCDFNRLMMMAELNQNENYGYGYYSKIGDTVYSYPYIMEGSAIIIAENPTDIQINDDGILRDMTFDDNYPLDPSLAQRVIIDIFTKDLKINQSVIDDIINDAQNQFKLLKNESK